MTEVVDHTIVAADGLALHARVYGAASPAAPTVLCLPGLARTAEDFEPLAEFLTAEAPHRRVVCLSYRGRGLSAWDPDPSHYGIATEQADIAAALAALEITRAVVVGTSRGGIHAMVLAVIRHELLQGVVLNDIGPVLEPAGLERIKGYVGKLPAPASWDDAVALMRAIAGAQFTGLEEADWHRYARLTFEERDGALRARYDPKLMQNLAAMDPHALAPLWDQFDALAGVPVLVIRGAHSDLLSPATLDSMMARLPGTTALTVPGQGHPPLLIDRPTLQAIAGFVARCEGTVSAPGQDPER